VVGIESLLHIVGEDLLASLIVKLPDFDRVEPEVGFAGGAECDCFLVVLVHVALAVVPETDCVEVLQLSALGGALESAQKVVIDVNIVEGFYYIGIVDKIICIRLCRMLDPILERYYKWCKVWGGVAVYCIP